MGYLNLISDGVEWMADDPGDSLMMKFVESVRLLVILADVLGSIIKGVVCSCLLLGINISPFSLLDCVVH